MVEDPANLMQEFSRFTSDHEIGMAYEIETSEKEGWYHHTPQGNRTFVGPTGLDAGVGIYKIRDKMTTWEAFQNIIQENEGNLPLGDQDVLNEYLAHRPLKFYKLACHWNRRTDSRCLPGSRGILHGNRGVFYGALEPSDEYVLRWTLVNTLPFEGFPTVLISNTRTPEVLPLLPTFKTREDIAGYCEDSKYKVGAELGVKLGEFAHHTLSQWTSCTTYVLVDLWAHQENYKDIANVDDEQQEDTMAKALSTLGPFRDKLEVCRNYTTVCATQYPDNFFDYVYVDARHDYKGVSEDLDAWWPKLKDGGIFSGHDYVTNDDGPEQSGQDWSINYDGSIDKRAVKGAVDDFASRTNRQVVVTYRESGWNSWLIRK